MFDSEVEKVFKDNIHGYIPVPQSLVKEFIDTETGALTEKAYKTIADYVLCHTV